MDFLSKVLVIALIILALMYAKDNFMPGESDTIFSPKREKIETPADFPESENPSALPEQEKPAPSKTFVSIYYTNANSGAMKKLSKELPAGEDKLKFAIKELLKGPDFKEKNQGYSSEIPKGTRLLSIKDEGSLIIIDISDDFQYGGGTESQYTRLNQLIKTVVNLHLNKPVYLYLNGQKAEAIGGEGIIINQPLSESSLNG